MHLVLRRGVSFCDIDDRLIFLDLPADRYFCLAGGPESAVRKAMRGAALATGDRAHLDGLIARGVLARGSADDVIRPCPGPVPAIQSLLGTSLPAPGPGAVSVAVVAMLASIARLRSRSLQRNVKCAAGSDDAPPARNEDHRQRLALLAAAFDRAAGILSAHDRCLAQSLAVARAARRCGLQVQIVFGVALGPFVAHCWVQCGPIVVNDRLDTIRTYTPILVR